MKFYNQRHLFYAGVDLHAKTFYVCIIDQNGEKRLHKNFQCQDTETFLAEIQPFRENLVVGCESTFITSRAVPRRGRGSSESIPARLHILRTPGPGGPSEDMETLIPHKEKKLPLFPPKKVCTT